MRRNTARSPKLAALMVAAALLLPAGVTLLPTAAQAEAAAVPAPLDAAAVNKLVELIDDRQRNSGDYKSLVYIETKERGKNTVVYEAVVYRRDADDRFMILFLKPKSERGKGYLRVDRNLWMYDPTVGRWERRTERERIGGTDSRRNDFDESNLAKEYTSTYVKADKLGRFGVHVLDLNAKAGVDVAYPKLRLWVDAETSNVLKRQEFAASGRLMRTSYTPKWAQVFSPSKKASVYVPEEMRIFDEVEKGNSTIVLIKKTDLNELPRNIFTKAWLESKSR